MLFESVLMNSAFASVIKANAKIAFQQKTSCKPKI